MIRLRHDDDALEETHEINVTPFIDVILVLLIIFMVAAPLATVDMSVDLPASNAPAAKRPDQPITLAIKADHSLMLGDQPVARDGLRDMLDHLSGGDHEQRVFVSADKTIDYGTLTDAMNDLRAAGYLKIALVGLDKSGAQ